MLFGSNTLFIGESQIWGSSENSYFLWGVRKKMYQIKKTSPPIRDFINEKSLNLLKFDCQNLPFRRISVSTRAEI